MKKSIILALSFLLVLHAQLSFAQFRRTEKDIKPSVWNGENLDYTKPVEYRIGGIRATGLNVLDENAMISLTGLKVGDRIKIPGEKISGAIRKLWKHGLVGDVSIAVDKIEGQNIFLLIVLSERPRLSTFYFTGINESRQSALSEEIFLIRGKIVNDAMIKDTELSVKKFFEKKGFLNTEVKTIQEPDTLNRGSVKLGINIKMNAKVRIDQVMIKGNKVFGASKLKRQLKKTKEHPRITLHRTMLKRVAGIFKKSSRRDSASRPTWKNAWEFIGKNIKLNIFASSKLIQSEFEEDKNNLIEFYNKQGYRDAVIVRDTIIKRSGKDIDVELAVKEGNKYYFRNITWTGNYIHNVTLLNRILDIKKGDVYNKELIDKKIHFNPTGADISGLYMDDGYLFFRVTPVEVAVNGDSIDIEMRIFEGDQVTLKEVTISGNVKTQEHVIRRELSTLPGQKFRRSDVIRTQQQLSQLGYFNPQKIEPDIQPNPADGTANIEWKLEEQSSDQIQLSGGWGGAYGFVGTVGLKFNNFSLKNIFNLKKWSPLPTGDGQRLSLSVQANGPAYQSYNFSFTEPWLGGHKPNSLTVSFNHAISRRRVSNTNFTVDNNVSLTQNGLTIGIGKRLEWPDNYFTLLNTFSFLFYDYKGNYFASRTLPQEGQTTSIKFETNLARNSIDNPMYPTQGSTISLSLTLTPPYSLLRGGDYSENSDRFKWVEMHKWMFDSKFYLKLAGSTKPNGRSLVLQTKAHFGFVGRYNDALNPGPFERFLLGGDGLAGGFNAFVLGQEIIGLRGYTNNSITPPLYSRNNTNNSSGITGGIAYTKVGMELRYPITLGQTANIYMFTFVEGGNNWDNFYEFNPFHLYKSAGAGLSIFMPAFGLLGLNWAYGFDTLPGALEKSGSQFHFTIGQQIR